MAEYTAAALQTVDQAQNILFTETPVPCTRGWVVHREGSGVFKLRGITDKCAAFYRIQFNGNVAFPEGGTPGPISFAIAIDGEPQRTSLSIVTPAAAETFNALPLIAIVKVPRGCCAHVSVVNVSTPAAPIDVQNANIEITRITA